MKLIFIIGIILAIKFLLSASLSGGTSFSLILTIGGPILIILILVRMLKSKGSNTGIDEIDRYL